MFRHALRRRPQFCPAGENFENRGLFSTKSLRKNVFRPGSRAPKTGFLGHLFLKSRKGFCSFWRAAKKCAAAFLRPKKVAAHFLRPAKIVVLKLLARRKQCAATFLRPKKLRRIFCRAPKTSESFWRAAKNARHPLTWKSVDARGRKSEIARHRPP